MKRTAFQQWCVKQHKKTNHKYAKYIPYKLHLDMAANAALKFESLFVIKHPNIPFPLIMDAIYGHDLLEDTRLTFNDVFDKLGELGYNLGEARFIMDIIYAVTNYRGRDRKERAPDEYYEGILNQPGATFVKLCDRIANVTFGLMTGGSMLERYRLEHSDFQRRLPDESYGLMFTHLSKLFSLRFTF